MKKAQKAWVVISNEGVIQLIALTREDARRFVKWFDFPKPKIKQATIIIE